MKKILIYLIAGLMAVFALNSCSDDNGDGDQSNIFINYDSGTLVSSAGETLELLVEAPGEWHAFSNVDWVTVITKSGTGNSTMSVTVSTNYSAQREGLITVSDGTDAATVKIVQAKADANGIVANTDCLLFEGQDDDFQRIELDTDAANWTATHDEWIHIGKDGNTAIVTVDPYYKYAREGKITFWAEDSSPKAEVAVYQANFIITHYANAYYLGDIEKNGFGRFILEIDEDMYQTPTYVPKILSMELAMEPLAFDDVELVPGIYTLKDALVKGYLRAGGTYEDGGITYISGTHEGDLTFFGYTRITVLNDGIVAIDLDEQTGDYTIKSFLKGTALDVDNNLAAIGPAYGCYKWQGPVALHNYIPREEPITVTDALANYKWAVGASHNWNLYIGVNGGQVNMNGYDVAITGESGGAFILDIYTSQSGGDDTIPDGTYYSSSEYGEPFAISSAQYQPVDAGEANSMVTISKLEITRISGDQYNIECDIVFPNNLTNKGGNNVTIKFGTTSYPQEPAALSAANGNEPTTSATVRPTYLFSKTYTYRFIK